MLQIQGHQVFAALELIWRKRTWFGRSANFDGKAANTATTATFYVLNFGDLENKMLGALKSAWVRTVWLTCRTGSYLTSAVAQGPLSDLTQ